MSVITWVEGEVKKIEADFSSAETEVEKVILPAAIAIVNVAKNLVVDDSTDIIGTLAAGAKGAGVEDEARAVLPGVLARMQLTEQFLVNNPSPSTIIIAVTKAGLALTGDARVSYLMEYASKIAVALSNGKLTLQQAIVLTQAFYAEMAGTATSAQTAALLPELSPDPSASSVPQIEDKEAAQDTQE